MDDTQGKTPPAQFTAQAAGEIKRAQFPATSGALVTLSAQTYWELLHAAQAWHKHQAQPPVFIVTPGALDPADLDKTPGRVVEVGAPDGTPEPSVQACCADGQACTGKENCIRPLDQRPPEFKA